MCEISPLLGATTKDMPKHIRGGATRQRADFAISPWDGADIGLGRVEKSLWWPTPRRFPLLTQAHIRPRQHRNLTEYRHSCPSPRLTTSTHTCPEQKRAAKG